MAGNRMKMEYLSYPCHMEIIRQLVFFMLVEDCLFYWVHRFLHSGWVYGHIHKQHHEFKETVSICSEYAHPLEVLIANTFPTVAGFKLLGDSVHLVTITMWLAMRITETIDGHSGYEFSWSPYRLLPCSAGASYHHYHHLTNQGNYSSFFTLWDTFCSTNKNYWLNLHLN